MIKEFKEFIVKGSMIDMAVGIVLGGAFGTVVNSLVKDIIMPPLGVLMGGVDFTNYFIVLVEGTSPAPYATLAAAQEAAAVTLNVGNFINALVSFLIVGLALFFVVKGINQLKRKEEAAPPAPSEKECPYCFTVISIKATRCPYCTSEIAGA